MRVAYILLFCLLCFASCKKGNTTIADGCISRIKRHYINGADSLAAVSLLKKNNIAYSNLAYDRIILNDTIKNVTTGAASVYQHIFALQYFNGLPLFFSDLGFHFNEGVFQSSTGARYNSINLNTVAVLPLQQVRRLFLAETSRNGLTATMKDSCLSAEFGYYNLGNGINNSGTNFVKAWFVTPQNSIYPQALIQDGTGNILYFFNGVYTFSK
jgi:hypothetical protein